MANTEALQYYQQALKTGQREYKNCVHRGLNPNIQALGAEKLQLSQVKLGIFLLYTTDAAYESNSE